MGESTIIEGEWRYLGMEQGDVDDVIRLAAEHLRRVLGEVGVMIVVVEPAEGSCRMTVGGNINKEGMRVLFGDLVME